MSLSRTLPLTALLLACAWFAFAGNAVAQTSTPQPEPATQPASPPETLPDDASVTEAATPGDAQPQPTPPPTLIARELLVLQADNYGKSANDPRQVQSSLFNGIPKVGKRTVRTDDKDADPTAPMPLGLITFEGKIDKPMSVTVAMESSPGMLLSHWPVDAQKNNRTINWFQVQSSTEGQRVVRIAPAEHWLASLREPEDRLWLRTRDEYRKERFMLYDTTFDYEPGLKILDSEASYLVSRTDEDSPKPELTMLLYKRDGGWASDTLTQPLQEKTTPIGTKAQPPATLETVKAALLPLAQLLDKRGYNAAEIEAAIGMISQSGLDRSDISLVYVLPQSEIEKHIRLTITPKPGLVVRTPIVVLTNVDPDLGSRLKLLIADLGSEDWLTREKAQAMLIDLGQAAIPKVEAVRDHEDPEIAFRAQQIYEEYKRKVDVSK